MSSTSPDPQRLRLDPESYEALRQQVLRRDGWRCQSRGAMSNLEVANSFAATPATIRKTTLSRSVSLATHRCIPATARSEHLVPRILTRSQQILGDVNSIV
jgi:hypothetical protein